jgi:hypothetical protein
VGLSLGGRRRRRKKKTRVSQFFSSQAVSSITALQAQMRLRLVNPFAFDLNVERIRLKIGYDDVDGVGVGGDSWPVKVFDDSPSTYGNLLHSSDSQGIVEDLSNFQLVPNVPQWTPLIGVPIGNMWENARRLYDEYMTKERMCLHAMAGTINAYFEGSGSKFR